MACWPRFHGWAYISIDPSNTNDAEAQGHWWTIEESFQAGKTLTRLDQHQVQRWTRWHRWTILAMLAYAFLAVTTAT